MTPTDFVAALAEAMEVSRTELSTVDRALAKAGLRQLARGKRRPDITLAEGVQLACAWAGAVNMTSAEDAVAHINSFHFSVGDMTGEHEEYVSDDYRAAFDAECRTLFGTGYRNLEGRAYLDVATMLARQIGTGVVAVGEASLSIEKKGVVGIRYGGLGKPKRFWFHDFGPLEIGKKRAVVTITVSIRGPVLKWIYDNTEGA